MEARLNALANLRAALQQMDKDLRNQATCPKCGKPISGIIQNGETKESSGLCTCKQEVKDSSK